MSTKYKNIILTCGMAVLVMTFSLSLLFKKPDAYSDSERRKLAQPPEFTMETIFSGKFMKDLETYTLDQFPLRDRLRAVKAAVLLGPLGRLDYNNLYIEDGYISKMEYPLNEKMLQYAADHISYLYDTYMAGKNMQVYFSVIPDKNYFLAGEHGALSLDYNALIDFMRGQTGEMDYIDITPFLTIDDYYRTDTHWRQEKITDVAGFLAKEMGTSLETDYEVHMLPQPFYGVYYGQLGLPAALDTLYYLTGPALKDCIVTGYGSGKPEKMELYDLKKAEGKDVYEIFLSGTQPLLTIENPNAETKKELILFRDSFGSSLAPLLASGYEKIMVIDTRYVSGSALKDLVSFENQDVLFLYSTTLLNNSLALH